MNFEDYKRDFLATNPALGQMALAMRSSGIATMEQADKTSWTRLLRMCYVRDTTPRRCRRWGW